MGRIEGPAHADHVLKVIAGNDAASSALAASWRRSGALYALDPASRRPPQRLPEPETARSRERMGSLLAAAQGSIDRLFLAVGGVGCSVVVADLERGDRRSTRRALRRSVLRRLRALERRRLEREIRRHERHRHLPRRAARGDHRPRPAFLHPQFRPVLHDRADFRRAWRTGRRARRVVLPGRPDRRLRASDRKRGRRRGPIHRGGELPSRLSRGAHPARAERRPLRVVAARGRSRRPGDRRDAGGANRARRQCGRPRPPDPGRRPDRTRPKPKATTWTRPSAPCFSARWRARAATCPRRRRTSTCRARPSIGR